MQADRNILNPRYKDAIKTLRKKAQFFERAERSFYGQKAKTKDLLLSDKNTSYFHSLVNRNNSRNYISFICRDVGIVIKDEEFITKEFVAFYYYSALFQKTLGHGRPRHR